MKREFLMLAQTYNPKKHGCAGWMLSEKIDGLRCFYDGGISRGTPAARIPWANTEKHARYKTEQIASGLWTRYGQPIQAPDWFLDALPPVMLDGELYSGRGNFQKVVSTVKRLEPFDDQWRDIRYVVFDAPRADEVFADGEIKNTNFKKVFSGIQVTETGPPKGAGFASRYKWLKALHFDQVGWEVLYQVQLPFKTSEAVAAIEVALDTIVAEGGEGVIMKSPSNLWVPERSHTMLKHKACNDAEGTVIGYTWGRETDKGSKLLGLMGALILRQDNGKTLELSGFTDAEREMGWVSLDSCRPLKGISEYGSEHPGEVCCDAVHNPMFPRGSRITYRYRELTDDGISKEARFFRKAP